MVEDIRKFKAPSLSNSVAGLGTSVAGMVVSNNLEKETSQEKQESSTKEEVIEEYIRFLESNGVLEEHIHAALDNLLTTGQFMWQFTLFDKIPVVFKVRPSFVNTLVIAAVENENPRTVSFFQDLVNNSNLAGSLYKYNNIVLDASTEESFQESKMFISKLPYVIVHRLIKELTIFDRLIAVATSDWAVENFTKPQPEDSEPN